MTARVWALAGLALAVRIWVLLVTAAPPEPFEYEELARNLLEGRGYTYTWNGASFRSLHSAVPYVLLNTAICGLTGHRHIFLVLAQALCSALLVFVVHRIALLLFDRATALGVAALTALHPGLIIYDVTKLHPLSLDALTIAAAVLACMSLRQDSSVAARVATGALIALGLFERGSLIAFAIAAPIIAARAYRSSLAGAARFALPVFVGIVLVFGPWIARNFVIHRTIVTMTVSSELFWRGNNPRATGTSYSLDGLPMIDTDPALQARVTGLDELGQMREFSRAARQFWRDSPGAATLLYTKKLVYFFSTTPTAGRLYPGPYFRVYMLYYAVCAAAAVVGVWTFLRSPGRTRGLSSSLRRLPLLCIVTIAVIQSAYYVEIRHRWGVEPIILIFTTAGAARLLAWVRSSDIDPARRSS